MASAEALQLGSRLDEHHAPETNGRMSVCRRCGAQTDGPKGRHVPNELQMERALQWLAAQTTVWRSAITSAPALATAIPPTVNPLSAVHMTQPERVSLFVRPSFPYAPGPGPTAVEYELQLPSGQVKTVQSMIDQAIEVEAPVRIRYRFVWGDLPGPWNDEGVTPKQP